eukprot:6747053-Pyramimonas_sp.AAC.1
MSGNDILLAVSSADGGGINWRAPPSHAWRWASGTMRRKPWYVSLCLVPCMSYMSCIWQRRSDSVVLGSPPMRSYTSS